MGRALVYAVGFAVPVTALALLTRERVDQLVSFDEGVIAWATQVTRSDDGFRWALLVWQTVTDPKCVHGAGALACLVAWRRWGMTTRAVWAFVTSMVAWNLALVLKILVDRARPVVEDPVSHAPGASFPSGHAANATVAATAVVLLLWPVLGHRARITAASCGALFAVITGLDRIFLGVHYPTDVLAGFLVGAGIVSASYAGYVGWTPATSMPAQPPVEDIMAERQHTEPTDRRTR